MFEYLFVFLKKTKKGKKKGKKKKRRGAIALDKISKHIRDHHFTYPVPAKKAKGIISSHPFMLILFPS